MSKREEKVVKSLQDEMKDLRGNLYNFASRVRDELNDFMTFLELKPQDENAFATCGVGAMGVTMDEFVNGAKEPGPKILMTEQEIKDFAERFEKSNAVLLDEDDHNSPGYFHGFYDGIMAMKKIWKN